MIISQDFALILTTLALNEYQFCQKLTLITIDLDIFINKLSGHFFSQNKVPGQK